jgi:hypothetical protein
MLCVIVQVSYKHVLFDYYISLHPKRFCHWLGCDKQDDASYPLLIGRYYAKSYLLPCALNNTGVVVWGLKESILTPCELPFCPLFLYQPTYSHYKHDNSATSGVLSRREHNHFCTRVLIHIPYQPSLMSF